MTRALIGRVLLLLFCLFAVACSKDSTSLPSPSGEQVGTSTSEIFRGYVIYGHEVRSFRPCGSKDTFWVQDQTGILWNLHQDLAPGQNPYEEIYCVLKGRRGPTPEEGFGADYSGELSVDEVVYAAREGFSCESDWSEFIFRVYGNEPFWSIELTGASMLLRRMGEPDLFWNNPRKERVGAKIVYTVDEGTLELVPEPCRDSMSGAFFGHTAILQFGSENFHGCALKGQVY